MSAQTLWLVYGPDLDGRFGSLQGTGGLEATILDAGGATQGVINDQFGNGVATVSGSSVTWNATRVGAYGPLPGTTATTLTDITQLAAATAWRGRRIDPTGFYDLGARYYEPTAGRFLSADPIGFAGGTNWYTYCAGDPINNIDPRGLVNYELGNPADKAFTGDVYFNPKGVYTISSHGGPNALNDWVSWYGGGGYTTISPANLVGQINIHSYSQGTPIILLACHIGAIGPYVLGGTDNYANQLSQLLPNTAVIGAQGFVYSNQATGTQESGLLPSWNVAYNSNLSQATEHWNVFYNGNMEVPLTNEQINSPDVASYIDASVAIGETQRVLDVVNNVLNMINGIESSDGSSGNN